MTTVKHSGGSIMLWEFFTASANGSADSTETGRFKRLTMILDLIIISHVWWDRMGSIMLSRRFKIFKKKQDKTFSFSFLLNLNPLFVYAAPGE